MTSNAKTREMSDVVEAFGAMSLEPKKPESHESAYKFVFTNADQGKTQNIVDTTREILRTHPDAVFVGITESGDKNLQDVVKPHDLQHWEVVSHKFPTYPGDTTAVYVNTKLNEGKPDVKTSDTGKYVNLTTRVKNSEGKTEEVSATFVHLPKKDDEKKRDAIKEVKKVYDGNPSPSLNIVLGDFNMNKDRVMQEGITGHPAFEKGELPTNSKKNSVNIDNAYSSRPPVDKRAADVGFTHNVGIVTYSQSK